MSEQSKRALWRCVHKHTGIEHPNCYNTHHAFNENIGFIDIETESLDADYGVIFCYCILDSKTGRIYENIINLDDIEKYKSKSRNVMPKIDKRVIESLVTDMGKFSRLVGHYSSLFDIPFIRTRAVMCGVDFPFEGSYFQTDTWRILKKKFKLSRNSLENSCLKLLGYSEKDKLSLSIKHGCLRGENWALKDTLEHCRKDVRDTKRLYDKIYGYANVTKSSI
jgi:uncharacterized protein YprB with RNaseH-like and TPR domain